METTHNTIYFWLCGWGTVPLSPALMFRIRYRLCIVDHEKITIKGEGASITIPIALVKDCEPYVFSSSRGAGSALNLRITLKENFRPAGVASLTNRIFFITTDVLTHNLHGDEMTLLQQTILAARDGEPFIIHANPYQRALERENRSAEFSEEKWRREVPPNVYTPFPSTLGIVFQLIRAVIVATLSVLVIVGVTYNLLIPWIQRLIGWLFGH